MLSSDSVRLDSIEKTLGRFTTRRTLSRPSSHPPTQYIPCDIEHLVVPHSGYRGQRPAVNNIRPGVCPLAPTFSLLLLVVVRFVVAAAATAAFLNAHHSRFDAALFDSIDLSTLARFVFQDIRSIASLLFDRVCVRYDNTRGRPRARVRATSNRCVRFIHRSISLYHKRQPQGTRN